MKVPGVSKVPTFRIKGVKAWQPVVLAVVLLAAGGGAYRFYAEASNTSRTGLTTNQQLVPAKYGDLVNQVSINGNLVFPQRAVLTFGSAGTIAELKVEAGQRLSKGQELARLDELATAALEAAAAQASLDLQQAQEALADAQQGFTPLERSQAEEKVANARFQLQVAVEALEDAESPYTQQELRTQEEKVAAARVALQDALDALANQTPEQGSQLAQAQGSRAAAESAVKAAVQALEDFQRDHNLQLAKATQSKAAAEMSLKTAADNLTAYEKRNSKLVEEVRREKTAAESDLAVVQLELDRLLLAQQTVSGDLTPRILQYQQAVELQTDRLRKVQADAAELENLEAAVEVAQASRDAATAEVARLEMGPDPVQRQTLQAAIDTAEANLGVAKEGLANQVSRSSSLGLALREAQLALAQATLAQAEDDLKEMLKGADSLDVAWRQRQVTLAEATLGDAEESLAELLARPDPAEVALRQAELALAKVQHEKNARLSDNAILKSPMDGIVSVLNVEQGDEVGASTVIAEIADSSIAELDGVVDEVDVLSVRQGAQARVTLDSLPGRTLRGTLISVAPGGTNQQGVVTYPIRVRLEIPQGVQAREGLSAAANIILKEEKNVLMVPQQALRGTFDQPAVRVMIAPSVVEDRDVVLGDTDGFWVAIREGLKEGDQVVMEAARASTSQFNFRQIRGGGVPGGFISGGSGGGGGGGGTRGGR